MTSVGHGRATGIMEIFPRLGPMPVKDVTGHRAAVYMLLESLKEGKYHKDHKQFDTIRKLWSTFRNVWGASVEEASMSFYLGFDDKKKQTISSCPTLSDWFSRFALGCKKRMGQDVRPQLGMSIEAMHALMNELEKKFQEEKDEGERNLIVNAGAYYSYLLLFSPRERNFSTRFGWSEIPYSKWFDRHFQTCYRTFAWAIQGRGRREVPSAFHATSHFIRLAVQSLDGEAGRAKSKRGKVQRAGLLWIKWTGSQSWGT
jgi:hypothetical protein